MSLKKMSLKRLTLALIALSSLSASAEERGIPDHDPNQHISSELRRKFSEGRAPRAEEMEGKIWDCLEADARIGHELKVWEWPAPLRFTRVAGYLKINCGKCYTDGKIQTNNGYEYIASFNVDRFTYTSAFRMNGEDLINEFSFGPAGADVTLTSYAAVPYSDIRVGAYSICASRK